MRKHLRTLLAAVAVTAIAGVASADNASFHFANASIDPEGDLLVSFKETGLGNSVSQVGMEVLADVKLTCQCVNRGGQCPSASNKSTISAEVDQQGNFPVRHGQTTGTIEVFRPDCGQTTPSCTPPMKLEPQTVSWTAPSSISGAGGITIIDTTENDSTVTTPSTISATLAPVCP
jgi:hypothetical protein